MTKKNLLFAAPLALVAGALFATPVSAAQNWNSPQDLRAQITQLDRQLDRIGQTNRLTNSESRRLHNAVDSLTSTYHEYARGGFTRREISQLGNRIDSVRDRIAQQARDDDRRGNDRFDGRRGNH